jgi:hypothetical protein
VKQAVSVDRAAVARWIENRDPSVGAIAAMAAWFDLLSEEDAPAPIVGYSASGDCLTEGPNGEIVAFSYIALPIEWVNLDGPYG